jgi:hypothetical protein
VSVTKVLIRLQFQLGLKTESFTSTEVFNLGQTQSLDGALIVIIYHPRVDSALYQIQNEYWLNVKVTAGTYQRGRPVWLFASADTWRR